MKRKDFVMLVSRCCRSRGIPVEAGISIVTRENQNADSWWSRFQGSGTSRQESRLLSDIRKAV